MGVNGRDRRPRGPSLPTIALPAAAIAIAMTDLALPPSRQRVLSGMRPTGALHLGHYHGAL